MGKSIKSRHYQKITQKGSWMERLPSATYLQKSHRWKGFQVWHINRKGCGWKGFQVQCTYRKVADGKASKCNVFTEKLQIERLPSVMYLQKSHRWKGFQVQCIYRKGPRGQGRIGCPLTSTPPSRVWCPNTAEDEEEQNGMALKLQALM